MNPRSTEDIKKCKETLKLLDLLRKSQCMSGVNGTYGKIFTTPKGDQIRRHGILTSKNECLQTMNLMEVVAKECLELSGTKLKP